MISSRPPPSHQPNPPHASALLPSAFPLVSSPGRDRERSKPSTSAGGGGIISRRPVVFGLGLGPQKGDGYSSALSLNARVPKAPLAGRGLFDGERGNSFASTSASPYLLTRTQEDVSRLKRKASNLRDAIPSKASHEDVFSASLPPRKPAFVSSRPSTSTLPHNHFRIPAPPIDLNNPRSIYQPPPPQINKPADTLPPAKRRRLDFPPSAQDTASGLHPPGSGQKTGDIRARRKDLLEWIEKYKQAMPKFKFYFDGDVSLATRRKAESLIKDAGASVDQFFSSKVTHLICLNSPTKDQLVPARPSPVAPKIKGVLSLKEAVLATKDLNSPRKMVMKGDTPMKLATDKGQSELVKSAIDLKIKVWSAEKLFRTLNQVLDLPQSAILSAPKHTTLSSLLEYEKLHGTRERDLSAPRPDHYYFPAGQGFILMSDALEEHRPIMVKEYERIPLGGDAPWPVLFQTFMKPSESAKGCEIALRDRRKKAWDEFVGADGDDQARRSIGKESRKQSTARALDKIQQELRMPYQAASGNSVILTSNIASTSNAGIMSGGTPNGYAGAAAAVAFGRGRNKEMMNMNKRVQVLKGNHLRGTFSGSPAVRVESREAKVAALPETNVLAEGLNEPVIEPELDLELEIVPEPEACQRNDDDVDMDASNDSQSPDAEFSPRHSTFPLMRSTSANSSSTTSSTTSQPMAIVHRQRVIDIIRQAKFRDVTPPKAKKIYKAKGVGYRVELCPPEGDGGVLKRPGYCENCKVKFNDFDSHIIGNRHKRFSQDVNNFCNLDHVIDRLARPLLYSEPIYEEVDGPFLPVVDEEGMATDGEKECEDTTGSEGGDTDGDVDMNGYVSGEADDEGLFVAMPWPEEVR